MRIGTRNFNITPIELGLIAVLIGIAILTVLPIFFPSIL